MVTKNELVDVKAIIYTAVEETRELALKTPQGSKNKRDCLIVGAYRCVLEALDKYNQVLGSK